LAEKPTSTPSLQGGESGATPTKPRGRRKLPAEKDPTFRVAKPIKANHTVLGVPAAALPAIPHMDIKPDPMYSLRQRMQRSEDSYQPYDVRKPASADPRNIFLYFDLYKTQLDSNYMGNNRLMDSVIVIIGDLLADSTQRITRIQIIGYASFDGPQPLNKRLAGLRGKAIKDYIQRVYPIADSVFVVHNGEESWAELRYGLEKEEFEGRDEVIRIIDKEADLDRREQLIRIHRKGETYRYMQRNLKHILRKLGSITIYCEER
jgi:outer membrane protein OmpA-like peptidoglycan-associated protein